MPRRSFLIAFLCCSAGLGQINENLLQGDAVSPGWSLRGGRVLAVTGVPGDPQTYYFGAAAGGVWKSIDGGAHWTPQFDQQGIASIGSIAVAPSDPNVLYVGSGEGCLREYLIRRRRLPLERRGKDVDQHWTEGFAAYSASADRSAQPRCSFGGGSRPRLRAQHGTRRVSHYRWRKELDQGVVCRRSHRRHRSGVRSFSNPQIVYAAMYQVQRQPWAFSSGGPGSGLYRSNDGGATWKKLEGNGLPAGLLGKIGVSVSGADPERVYALIEAEKGGLYRSDDGGNKWERVNDDERYRQRAWYFSHVFADPQERRYGLRAKHRHVSLHRWRQDVPTSARAAWRSSRFVDRPLESPTDDDGDDGGATISIDGGKNWTPQLNQPTAQFYHIATDNRFPYYLFGAQQDNTALATAAWSDAGLIGMRNWYEVAGAESAFMAPDPRDGNVVFSAGRE